MRWFRIMVAALMAATVAAIGQAATAHAGYPSGYQLWSKIFNPNNNNEYCQLHTNNRNNIRFVNNFYGVRAFFILDGYFAAGDSCRIGKSNLVVSSHSQSIVLYDENGVPRWSMGSPYYVETNRSYSYLQGLDGNFVQYSENGAVLGATNTCCTPYAYEVVMAVQSDGNLVVYWYHYETDFYEVKFTTNTAH
ncbi:hypothetical protein [Dactylosporangium salmoneum]|uniref:Bulb-type lectin domain-containing protein n=1 Tax=Dactylosporangium salmoneum TaxID=53361 RepID=A0ABN3GH78_9ACTN